MHVLANLALPFSISVLRMMLPAMLSPRQILLWSTLAPWPLGQEQLSMHKGRGRGTQAYVSAEAEERGQWEGGEAVEPSRPLNSQCLGPSDAALGLGAACRQKLLR